MEETNLQKKGSGLFFPILIVLLLFIVNLCLAYAVLYPEKLWKTNIFLFNPVRTNTFSYGVMQQLNLEVIDIQDFEDHNGDKGKKFIFSIPEDNDIKTLEKYVIGSDGNYDEFNKLLLYWSPADNDWVTFEEKPESVPDGISVGDMVTLNYYNYYEKGVQDISIKIQTVEHHE